MAGLALTSPAAVVFGALLLWSGYRLREEKTSTEG